MSTQDHPWQSCFGLRMANRMLCRVPALEGQHSISCHEQADALPDAWEELTQGASLFLQRDYLRILEQHGPDALTQRYAVISQDGQPAAAVAAQFITVENELLAVRDRTEFNSQQRPLARAFDRAGLWLRNRGLGLLGRRVMVLGNLYSCGLDGVAFAPGVDRRALWPMILDAAHRLQESAGGVDFVVAKDFPVMEEFHRDALKRTHFARLQIEPCMELHAPEHWRSRADYLDALNTKYRKAARKMEDAIAHAGYVVESLHDLASDAGRLHELYRQVEQRAIMRFGVMGSGYLPAIAKAAGQEGCRCTVLRRQGRIDGFSLVLKSGDTALAHVVGFDYAANAQAPIYLRLLHSVIDDGLSLGCRVMHFGRTALEPKARLGAKPVETEIWIRHNNAATNPWVSPMLRLVPQDKAPQRDPFRK